MVIRFATKRDINGNRKYLAIDFARKEYATDPASWYCKEDIIEIKISALRKLKAEVINKHFTNIDYI